MNDLTEAAHSLAARAAMSRRRVLAPAGIRAYNRTLGALSAPDPVAALDVLRPPTYAEPPTGGPGVWAKVSEARRSAAEQEQDLARAVGGFDWYHTITLPGGVTTQGFYDHRPILPIYGLPERLDGRRVLDVGTFDGFWAFELERRGGRVEAVDIASSTEIDLPPAARARAEMEKIDVPTGGGFALAAAALGSKVVRHRTNVYHLDPAAIGTFDFVHFGDLLLHLERPWAALAAMRRVTSGTLHFADAFEPALKGVSASYRGGWRDCQWWIPSLDCLAQWVIDAGFRNVELLRVYDLDNRPRFGAAPRAIFRAEA